MTWPVIGCCCGKSRKNENLLENQKKETLIDHFVNWKNKRGFFIFMWMLITGFL